MLRQLREFLGGHRSRFEVIRYVLRDPHLLFALRQRPSNYYLTRAFEQFLDQFFTPCLYDFFPDYFTDHLVQRGFSKNDSIGPLLYALVRARRPQIVIETGVAKGASSAFILLAMRENRWGHLYSIDLPIHSAQQRPDGREATQANCTRRGAGGNMTAAVVLEDGQKYTDVPRTEGISVGYLIPEQLKPRWTLIEGDARVELPSLLSELGKISIFLHDSLHTYDHMLFEFKTAWPYVEDGGLLLSHDVVWNKAFLEFSDHVRSKPVFYYSLGIIKK
jgi:cephalosporin hydroxylase